MVTVSCGCTHELSTTTQKGESAFARYHAKEAEASRGQQVEKNYQYLCSLSEQGSVPHIMLPSGHRLQLCWQLRRKATGFTLLHFSNCFEFVFLDISEGRKHPELSPGLLVNTLRPEPKYGKVSGPGPLHFHVSINLRG